MGPGSDVTDKWPWLGEGSVTTSVAVVWFGEGKMEHVPFESQEESAQPLQQRRGCRHHVIREQSQEQVVIETELVECF